MASKLTALLLGGTGATGKRVLEELKANDNYGKILFLTRRDQEINDPKVEVRKVDFDNLNSEKDGFAEADVAFCCLGTTKAKAGKDGFIKVDFDYVVNSAKLLKEGGKCQSFHVLSSQGANPNSMFLYLGTKGKVEEAVKAVGIPKVSIYRPGVLITAREDPRMFEGMAQSFFNAFDKSSSRSIKVEDLAKAMVLNSVKPGSESIETLEQRDIMNTLKEKTTE